jgi:hypothetical protein
MTYCRYFAIQLCLVFLLLTSAAFAHHSDTPHFFMDQNIPYEGVITEFKFVNPHAYVYFDVAQEDGSAASTRCELPAAITLRRLGWTETTFVVGEFVRLNASPARREGNHCYLNELVLLDGTVVSREDAGPVLVQEREAVERPLNLANGQPNISGDWVAQPRSGPREQNTQTAGALVAAESFDFVYDHPGLQCESVGITHGYPFGRFPNRITQTENIVQIIYGYMDLERIIHLDQDSHPDNIPSSRAGHSIGHWQDNVLIVHTSAISEGTMSPINQVMHSDQLEVTERFWYEEQNQTLIHEYTATDPLFFENPYNGRDVSDVSAVSYQPYACEELSGANNIRPEA